jgi:hypothetical protein
MRHHKTKLAYQKSEAITKQQYKNAGAHKTMNEESNLNAKEE